MLNAKQMATDGFILNQYIRQKPRNLKVHVHLTPDSTVKTLKRFPSKGGYFAYISIFTEFTYNFLKKQITRHMKSLQKELEVLLHVLPYQARITGASFWPLTEVKPTKFSVIFAGPSSSETTESTTSF